MSDRPRTRRPLTIAPHNAARRDAKHQPHAHLHIETDSIADEVARLQRLGAIVVTRKDAWVVMQAPGGHRFCVASPIVNASTSTPIIGDRRNPMDKIEFTDEERTLILAMASSSEHKSERILAHLPWVAPGVAFIAYGVVTGQIHAVTIGALSVLLYQGWGLVQELRYSALYTAIFRKIARTFTEPAAPQNEPPQR